MTPDRPLLDRTVFWTPWSGPGLEHLRLRAADDVGYVANGTVLGLEDGVPFRLQYEIKIDGDWRVRQTILDLHHSGGSRVLTLRTDGRGHWRSDDGGSLTGLDGCFDIDISATPFTNTLPVRRLDLRPGQRADLRMVYVLVPSLGVRAVDQRYTCRDRDERGWTVIFEDRGLFTGFTAELPIDPDGLVIDYPDLFRRIEPPS